MTPSIEQSRAAISAAIVAVECALDVAARANDVNEVRARLQLTSKSLRRAFAAPFPGASDSAEDAPEPDAPEAPDGLHEAEAPDPEAAFGRMLQGYKLPKAAPMRSDPAMVSPPDPHAANPFGTMLPPAQSMPPGNKAPTRHDASGRMVYGEPFDDEMRARAQRDKINVPIKRAIIAVRHYAVRGYAIDALTHPGSIITYTRRRDGKVGMMLVPADRVLSSEPFA